MEQRTNGAKGASINGDAVESHGLTGAKGASVE